MNTHKQVFVSHHHADDEHVSKLTDLLRRNGFEIRNSSIRAKPANRERLEKGMVSDETIRRLLRRKMAWASTVIVLIGHQTHSRPWVEWEIRKANELGKRIVGVYARGATQADVPAALEEHGTAIVGWNSDRIIDAIEGKANPFENPDSTPRAPVHSASTSRC